MPKTTTRRKPAKKAAKPQVQVVQTRLTLDLVQELGQRATADGISVADYLRRLVLKDLGKLA